MPSYFSKPNHWRLQADMTRTIAKGMHGMERQILDGIANDYDKMAAQLETDDKHVVKQLASRQQVDIGDSLVALQKKWSRR
jgi:hypothetical protein